MPDCGLDLQAEPWNLVPVGQHGIHLWHTHDAGRCPLLPTMPGSWAWDPSAPGLGDTHVQRCGRCVLLSLQGSGRTFLCFPSIIVDVQCYISFRHAVQWSDMTCL